MFHCPIEVLAERDVKGLYKKALNGEIPSFTGFPIHTSRLQTRKSASIHPGRDRRKA